MPVGRIAGAFGIAGELKCDPTNAGRPLFSPGAELRCERGSDAQMVRIASVRAHKGRLLLRIAGVEDADAAQAFNGAVLLAPRESIPLQAGEYFDDDLTGCAVVGADGKAYGTVDRVEHYPSSDMLVVGGRLVPMVAAIVREIDSQKKRIVIDPPAGLLD
ncbi:MAG: 16S rRNA processing protein RimM [Candidatus Eremiobacteraeota bacterium]|nr:16S rRNA processing protein RimM [Candidatus Eremiobacteraeota bacterium]